jgi:hypothetical protein
MAQSGFTPISLYYTTTAAAVPLAANLVPGELAINITDGKLYYENNSGVVTLLADRTTVAPVTTFSAGTTGFTPSTATSGAITLAGTLVAANGGTGQSSYAVGDLLFASTTTALSKLADVATGNALISGGVGVAPSYGKIGLTTHVSGTLPIANGGTNATATPTAGAVPYGTGTAYAFTAVGTAGQILQSNGASAPTWINNATGTVTTLSVVSANGFAGTVANATTTPAITLTTSITGMLKGNGTAISAGTAGTDYVAPGTATTFTALQTFAGTTSNADLKTSNIVEVATVSATAATGTINYDITTQSVLYYTSNASANWTVNFRGSSGTSLNTLMQTGESISTTFLVTQGATAYYNSAVQIDGTTSGVTTEWQGGTAPTTGNASSVDSYTYVIIKTGSATYLVLATQTRFA